MHPLEGAGRRSRLGFTEMGIEVGTPGRGDRARLIQADLDCSHLLVDEVVEQAGDERPLPIAVRALQPQRGVVAPTLGEGEEVII
jgi:hypothetical protein